jgi:hypothetical protein
MGRLAEAEGEAKTCRDLRTKIFINPNDVKAQYQKARVRRGSEQYQVTNSRMAWS